MFDAYKMVAVNAVAVCLLCAGLLLYRYVYPKKTISPLLIIILCSCLPLISVFRKGVYESGDFNLQIYRSVDFYHSLTQGVFLPRWGATLNASYGHPIFMFAAPLPYYVISFFHALGLSFINSMKALLITGYIASGITMYFFVKKDHGEKAALVAALFYLFAPFHFVDLHFRVSIGDVLAFAFYPLAFLFSITLIKERKVKESIFLSIIIVLLITAHPITFPAIGFLIVYAFFYAYINKKLKNLWLFGFSIVNGLLLSAFYWYPLIKEAKYTVDGTQLKIVFFTPFWQLLYSPWRYGLLFQGPYGELSFLVGYIQYIVVGIGIYMLIKKKTYKNISLELPFLLISLALLLFMITPQSALIWKYTPLINSMQFSVRLMFIAVLLTAFIAGIVLKHIKNKKITTVLVFLAIITTILNWGNRRVIPTIDDAQLIRSVPYATAHGEGATPSLTIWRDPKHPWMEKIPKQSLDVLQGQAEIKQLSLTPISSEYIVNARTPIFLRRNLFYFPGWSIYDNGKKVTIDYQKTGIILFSLPKGLHALNIVFEDTKERKTADILSILGIFITFCLFLSTFIKKTSFFH